MALSDAEVKMSLADLQTMQGRIKELELVADQLHTENSQIQSDAAAAGERTYQATRAALSFALEVVRFAVGNLNPLTVRGWPWRPLVQLIEALDGLPGVEPALIEAIPDMRLFARDCEKWERARDLGQEQELLASENAQSRPIAQVGA